MTMSMADAWEWVVRALAAWPGEEPAPGVLPEAYRRLADAMRDAVPQSPQVGAGDLAGLVRTVLRGRDDDSGLAVPSVAPWPSGDAWHAVDVTAVQSAPRRLLVRARPWRPTWLSGADAVAPAAGAERAGHPEGERRHYRTSPADPMFLEAHDTYRGDGQRQAVRAMFSARDGATIVVTLPTGTGKSAVATVPALQWSRRGGVSVVIVPTIALALDQERAAQRTLARMGEAVPGRLAYYSGTSEDARDEIRARIRDGTQRIVFVGPEMATRALTHALHVAAAAGHLRLFVVDEAHLIDEWGTEFRPEFQLLAGLRTSLARECERNGYPVFRTLLMTATLNDHGLATLRALFGTADFHVVAAPILRPEPSWWAAQCEDQEQRADRVLETVGNAPLPTLVYCSTKESVADLVEAFRLSGRMRIASFTGDDNDVRRLEVIEGFTGSGPETSAETKFDIVVATSAFGLGVDHPGVRTVVHACVPETIDRYYQEVGRAGRDGDASVAIALYVDADFKIAKRLNRQLVLTPDLARRRWAGLEATELSIGDARVRVSLAAERPGLPRTSKANMAWNARTLTLLTRAGLLALDAEPPPERADNEDAASWERRRDEEYARRADTVVIRRLADVTGALVDGSAAIDADRELVRSATRDSLERVFELLRTPLSRDVADILAEAYSVDIDGQSVRPARACGGCAFCRPAKPWVESEPHPRPLGRVRDTLRPWLARRLDMSGGRALVVLYDSDAVGAWPEDVFDAVRRLVGVGVRTIAAPEPELEQWRKQGLHRRSGSDRFVFMEPVAAVSGRTLSHWLPHVPTVLVHAPTATPVISRAHFDAGEQWPARVLIAPSTASDQSQRPRPLRDLVPTHLTLDRLLELI